MQLIPTLRSWTSRHELLGRRASGLLAVAIVHLLGFLLLLSLAPDMTRRLVPEVKNFSLIAVSEKPAPKAAAKAPVPRRTPPTTIPPPIVPPLPQAPLNMILMTREEYRASDISKFRPQQSAQADAGDGAGDSGVDDGKGEGPGGAKLYPADWYREPTTAEMAYYLKGRNQAGWGMIACRTIPDNRVEDCREMGESPRGSGLSNALRQAAWQFRIRPPRVNGKPQMGVWVRILFDYQMGIMK